MIKKEDLYIRDPFIYFENGVYYLYSAYQKKMNFILLLWYTNQKI